MGTVEAGAFCRSGRSGVETDKLVQEVCHTREAEENENVKSDFELLSHTDNGANQYNDGDWDDCKGEAELDVLGTKDHNDELKGESYKEKDIKDDETLKEEVVAEGLLESEACAKFFENVPVKLLVKFVGQKTLNH